MITEFTPITSLIGGLLIGLASILTLIGLGKIAGISGIFFQGLRNAITKRQLNWQIYFIAGLIIGPIIASLIGFSIPSNIDLSWSQIIIGGLLVGFGTRYGSGCTSGHGICGIGRFSPRSIAATMIFMLTAIATVFIIRHVIGA
ncbi:YeeE/YedE family protein [Thalassotalea crassostreae]|uniref:YeeE/YedE family protein n=1 Tax=Thalassotalea crassostreae TaxID=1763536 RepID=UPI000B137BCC|nr:YeeE/YedE thiosulfate transporter family protein [Thalassotalea crassostreae]